ncbi:hypothetical protein CR513_03110, partial [Mucuna pruriens]
MVQVSSSTWLYNRGVYGAKKSNRKLIQDGRMRSGPLESSLRGTRAKLQDETTIMSRIDPKVVGRAELPPSRNNSNNSWRGIHGRNVDLGLKKVLSIGVGHSGKTCRRQDLPITFTNKDYEGIILHTNDSMLAFKTLGFSKSSLEECLGMLIGFIGEQVEIRGVINLETILGTSSTRKVVKMRFMVVNSPTSYNVILGRSTLY